MKLTVLLIIGKATAAALAQPSYLSWMADSWMRHDNDESIDDISYGRATIDRGYEYVIEFTGNETLLDWYHTRMDGLVAEDGTIVPGFDETYYSLDDYRFGHSLLYWYERSGEAKYKIAAETIRGMYDRHPRTPTGGFWHRFIYENQMWLDGIYMADTFYARWTSLFDSDNQTAWDDIVLQFDKIDAVTRKPEINLLVHGFDESKKAVWADPETGASPLVWNRAVGWYFMALFEILEIFPQDHAGYTRLKQYFATLADGLLHSQDPDSHGWWLMMTEAGREDNYFESSGAAMFTWGLLAGIRKGWLDEKTYLQPATNAYAHLLKDFVSENDDGTITFNSTVEVGSLKGDATYEVSPSFLYISLLCVE
jgi:rhamnogalacturonyl hydrolase YesR